MFGLQQPTGGLKGQVRRLAYELAATWCWPTLAQRNRSELSQTAGAVDDSTINIIVVIIIIIIIIKVWRVCLTRYSPALTTAVWHTRPVLTMASTLYSPCAMTESSLLATYDEFLSETIFIIFMLNTINNNSSMLAILIQNIHS